MKFYKGGFLLVYLFIIYLCIWQINSMSNLKLNYSLNKDGNDPAVSNVLGAVTGGGINQNTQKLKSSSNTPPVLNKGVDSEVESPKEAKRNIKIMETLKYLTISSGVFQPLSYMIAEIDKEGKENDKNQKEEYSKCSKKKAYGYYDNQLIENMNRIKEIKLSKPFEERFKSMTNRCNKLIKDYDSLQQVCNDMKKQPLDPNEQDESLVQNINEAKDCKAVFKQWSNATEEIDVSSIKPACMRILEVLGCGANDSAGIRKCLEGEKDPSGKVVDKPEDKIDRLSKININPSEPIVDPRTVVVESQEVKGCEDLNGIHDLNSSGKLTPLGKFVARFRAALNTFNDFIKCHGVSKPYLDEIEKVSNNQIMQIIINFITADNLSQKSQRLKCYLGKFVGHVIKYFRFKKFAKQFSSDKNKSKLMYKMVSRFLGSSIGYFIRTLLMLFKTDWSLIFKPSEGSNPVSVSEQEIDGIKIFDDWNLNENKSQTIKKLK